MKKLKLLFAIAAVALLFSQCTYDFIVPVEIIDPDDPNTEQVSFAGEIIPILEGSCTACHSTGNQFPDLSAGSAYSNITSMYIDEDNPEQSEIYTKPNPSSTSSHPKFTEAEAALVLTWIIQGAQNN